MANRKIAYTLGRGRAYISDMSSTSGYMGEKYVQEFGQKYMPVLCQEYMLFFCLPLSSQPRLNLLSTQQQGRAPPVWPEQLEPLLTTQWQTEKLHILLAEDGHIVLTCLQLVGTVGKHFFRNSASDF